MTIKKQPSSPDALTVVPGRVVDYHNDPKDRTTSGDRSPISPSATEVADVTAPTFARVVQRQPGDASSRTRIVIFAGGRFEGVREAPSMDWARGFAEGVMVGGLFAFVVEKGWDERAELSPYRIRRDELTEARRWLIEDRK